MWSRLAGLAGCMGNPGVAAAAAAAAASASAGHAGSAGEGGSGGAAAASPARGDPAFLFGAGGVPREAPLCGPVPAGPCGHLRCARGGQGGVGCLARAENEARVEAYRRRTASGRPGLALRYSSDVLPPRLCQALIRAARVSLGVSKVAGPGGVDQASPDRTSRTATLYLRAQNGGECSHADAPARLVHPHEHLQQPKVKGLSASQRRQAPASAAEHDFQHDEVLMNQARTQILAWMAAFAPESAPDPTRTLAVQVVRYSADAREYYRPHFDTSSKEDYKRRRSHIFYLNDVPAGGCTAFPCSEMDTVRSATGTVFSAGDWWARLSDTEDVPWCNADRDEGEEGGVGDGAGSRGGLAGVEEEEEEEEDEKEEDEFEGMGSGCPCDGTGIAGGRFLWVQPVAGAALSWRNTREHDTSPSERLDPCSLHCSLPVTSGEKWVCTVWN